MRSIVRRPSHQSAALVAAATRFVTVLALMAAVAGCTGDNDAALTEAEPTTAAEPNSVVAAAVSLPTGDLFGPVAGEGALWLRHVGSGDVLRVDPKTNRLAATIEIGPGCCLSVGEGAVWAAIPETHELLRIEPASNQVTTRIGVGQLPQYSSIAFGSVWVSNHLGGTVSRIDPETNQVVANIQIATPPISGPRALGPGGNYMWVGVPGLGEVVRIDPTSNRVSGALKMRGAGCHDLTTDSTTLWLSGGCLDAGEPRTIWKIDTEQMQVTATIEPGGNVGTPVFWKGQLWVLTSHHLISVDPTTDQVSEQAAIRGPGWAAVLDGTLWVSSPPKLLRLHLN
jgi:YVTN family beta-propeller protein